MFLDIISEAVEDLDLKKIMNVVVQNNIANDNEEKETAVASKEETKGKSKKVEEEIMEEEVVELEFEKVLPKLNTHTMYCPNCDHQITKVVLRRKLITRQPVVIESPEEQRDLVGCFSCFSLFTCLGNF